MTYRKNYLFKAIIIAILLLPTASISAERNDLYTTGRTAFDNGNYVVALKNLYAFYIINEIEMNKYPAFKVKLQNIIKISERKLTQAMASSKPIGLTGVGVLPVIQGAGTAPSGGFGGKADSLEWPGYQ